MVSHKYFSKPQKTFQGELAKWWLVCKRTTVKDIHYSSYKPALGPVLAHHWLAMMTSSNGNIFRVTGHLCGEFTGHRWIPRTKASVGSFDVFFDLRLNKKLSIQPWGWWFRTPSRPLWRYNNGRGVPGQFDVYLMIFRLAVQLLIIIYVANPKREGECKFIRFITELLPGAPFTIMD